MLVGEVEEGVVQRMTTPESAVRRGYHVGVVESCHKAQTEREHATSWLLLTTLLRLVS